MKRPVQNASNTLPQVYKSSIARAILQTFLILGLSFLIGLADFLTGPDFAFSPFYLIPPSLAAWRMSRKVALFAAFINTFTWLWVDFLSGRFQPIFPVYAWNFTSRLISLLVVVILFSRLRKSMDHEKKLARTDILTGALNSRAFNEALDLEIKRSLRYNSSLTLVYMDVDNFKLVNDRFGHKIGDHVLATIGSVIRDSIRQNDVLGRLGGDEFGILLLETDPLQAYAVVTKLQEMLMPVVQKNKWPISFSCGALSCTHTFCSAEKMISEADQLMYSVKKSTKNNVNFAIYSDTEKEIR
jgi:diguanylate cyclase (GGDEF)-like protein